MIDLDRGLDAHGVHGVHGALGHAHREGSHVVPGLPHLDSHDDGLAVPPGLRRWNVQPGRPDRSNPEADQEQETEEQEDVATHRFLRVRPQYASCPYNSLRASAPPGYARRPL